MAYQNYVALRPKMKSRVAALQDKVRRTYTATMTFPTGDMIRSDQNTEEHQCPVFQDLGSI